MYKHVTPEMEELKSHHEKKSEKKHFDVRGGPRKQESQMTRRKERE